MPISALDLTDIQGNILKNYKLPLARYVFFQVNDAAAGRELVGKLVPRVTTSEAWRLDAARKPIKPTSALNVAFTHRGLAALGLPIESLATFPAEFQEGMRARANLLGDDGSSAPERWDAMWQQPVHIWVGISAIDDASRDQEAGWLADQVNATNGGVVEVGRQHAGKLPGSKEHFGFTDGISDPDVEGSEQQRGTRIGKLNKSGQWEPLANGEFLLGQADEALETAGSVKPLALARNGTFMVYRKLHQNVASFRSFLRREGARYGSEELLAAKMVGRWRDGTPLSLSPDSPDPSKVRDNSFTYADDRDGSKCPLTAHIRRVNPRDALGFGGVLANRRRIIRRGLPYGDEVPDGPGTDDGEHGVVFMALNASIERQFEFIQFAWVNGGNSFGLANDKDPIAGNHAGSGQMVVPGKFDGDDVTPPYIVADLPRFIVTRGGEYFFIPGMNALRMIAKGRVDMR